jgi:hypothetical protein
MSSFTLSSSGAWVSLAAYPGEEMIKSPITVNRQYVKNLCIPFSLIDPFPGRLFLIFFIFDIFFHPKIDIGLPE